MSRTKIANRNKENKKEKELCSCSGKVSNVLFVSSRGKKRMKKMCEKCHKEY